MGSLTKKITKNPSMTRVVENKDTPETQTINATPVARPRPANPTPPLNKPILPLSRNVLGKKNDFKKIRAP